MEPAPLLPILRRLAAHPDEDAAWRDLLTQRGRVWGHIAQGVLRREDLAADAVQDALLYLRAHLDEAKGLAEGSEDSLRGWLDRIVWSSALQVLRGERRRKAREQEHGMAMHGGRSEDPSRSSVAGDQRDQIVRAMADLSDPDRCCLTLHFHGGLDHAAVAAVLGCTASTARVRLHRALKRLGERLGRIGLASSVAATASLLAQERTAFHDLSLSLPVATDGLSVAQVDAITHGIKACTTLTPTGTFLLMASLSSVILATTLGLGAFLLNDAPAQDEPVLAPMAPVDAGQIDEAAVGATCLRFITAMFQAKGDQVLAETAVPFLCATVVTPESLSTDPTHYAISSQTDALITWTHSLRAYDEALQHPSLTRMTIHLDQGERMPWAMLRGTPGLPERLIVAVATISLPQPPEFRRHEHDIVSTTFSLLIDAHSGKIHGWGLGSPLPPVADAPTSGRAAESEAKAFLVAGMMPAQIMFQAGAWADSDGNRVGRFGCMDDLLAGNLLDPKQIDHLRRSGFDLHLYVPDTTASAHATGTAITDDSGLKERRYVAYAVRGGTAEERRIFAITEQGILWRKDTVDVDDLAYDGDQRWNLLFGGGQATWTDPVRGWTREAR